MKLLFSIVLLFALYGSYGQTKVIAHKSHSGSNTSFGKAYHKNLFDIKRSNFGLPGNRNIVVLDKVRALNDSLTVLYFRESIVCYQYGTSYKGLKNLILKQKPIRLKIINYLGKQTRYRSLNPLKFAQYDLITLLIVYDL